MNHGSERDRPLSVAVLGANGWIGQSVVRDLAGSQHRVVCLSRRRPRVLPTNAKWTRLDAQVKAQELAVALRETDAVISVAGAAHLADSQVSTSAIFSNEELPRVLGEAAMIAGVSRVVHLSSIKAVGEGGNEPLRPADVPRPTTDYGKSKLAGERAISEVASSSLGIRLVIVRPPMVYGPQAPGNIARLSRLAMSRGPVPLPVPYPKRSLVYLGNLSSLLMHLCLSATSPARVVHLADIPHLTTRELVTRIANAAGARDRVVPIPVGLFAPIARLAGRSEDFARVVRDLVVEPSSEADLADWVAPYPAHAGFRKTFAPSSSARPDP